MAQYSRDDENRDDKQKSFKFQISQVVSVCERRKLKL